ncbi:MAG: bifunctional 3-deoxy-7-phosphoheptulonate synthase/chorismate mutase [Chloracidobacterium sp.]|uniref:Bifunctional 3-deoxy-7-phosphoheptulonate synthase/chorismate mutase n=1 Tax=Chloracidobacterium validum TaxID=2821543 RepID=A0ABX8BBZ1_9BACT|nr:bifunctional 3-deoxy-7-phosphoheptulonate synthase/chorismate mutase [Chloracidobacterium validum]QUW04219.1 bifunctional 3-deoxy-7-phosphoheptulonate synthase/chorismate mutase [Chloracidobacterium validum]
MLVHRSSPTHQTTVSIAGVPVGEPGLALIAGPCAAESERQLRTVAERLALMGIQLLRAGVYKPRTSPYSFQGLQEPGLELLRIIKRDYGLGIVSEVMSVAQLDRAYDVFDCFQVGSRNMQNFELLKALGQTRKPVLLKRGLAATIEEFLGAAEYIVAGGNAQVILCERGIRSFDPATRNVLDLGAVALLKRLTHLPVLVDPSHATGRRDLVLPAARAAAAVGADGLIVECHPTPEQSVSDAAQALSLDDLAQLVTEVSAVAQAVGRGLSYPVERAA